MASALTSPIAAQVTTRASEGSHGEEGNGWSWAPDLSDNGRFIAFYSQADNLLLPDDNGVHDVFLKDTWTGELELISRAPQDVDANDRSSLPAVSAHARFVAYQSKASNLVPNDTNGTFDIFVRDRQSALTERVSLDSAGIEANGRSEWAAISGDGRYVAFSSLADNLVPNDTNATWDVFVRDRLLGQTERVSVDSFGAEANGRSEIPALSADGRFVAFQSKADNLVTGDNNGHYDIFVHDRDTGTTTRVSVRSNGAEANNRSDIADLSDDGRYVSFQSLAGNLVPGDQNVKADVFVHDTWLGLTERVSLTDGGLEGNGDSFEASISADGNCVAFMSNASNLVPGDTNGVEDIYLRDRQSGITERVSLSSTGEEPRQDNCRPVVNADGRWVCWQTASGNLVPLDQNRLADVFLRDRHGLRLEPPVWTAGQTGRLAVEFATPGSQVSFLASTTGFARRVVKGGLQLELEFPLRILATVGIGPDGRGEWTFPVPQNTQGLSVFLQSVERRGAALRTSQPAATTIR